MEKEKKITGETLRILRKNANNSVLKFYGGVISTQYAYRVERGIQQIGLNKLNQILNKNDILFDEFLFIKNNFNKQEFEQIMDQFFEIQSSLEVEKISLLLKRIDKVGKKEDSFLSYLYILLQGYIEFNKNRNIFFLKQKVYEIWTGLAKKEEWTYCDLVMISNIIYVFDVADLESMLKRILKEFKRYEKFKNIRRLKMKMLFNCCTAFRLNNQVKKTKPILNQILNMAISAHDGLIICECEFRLAEIDWLEGKKSLKAINSKLEKIFITLSVMRYPEIVEDLKEDWERRTGNRWIKQEESMVNV
ncbi:MULTISPECIES: hypothetical protein [Listeria]|uniref:Rgg family transcriptional regulator n=1 Tax=Listeria TaxID=1637 RepID=UPI000B5921D6|nr:MULTISPECIES: hypothetical protein [Listeria]